MQAWLCKAVNQPAPHSVMCAVPQQCIHVNLALHRQQHVFQPCDLLQSAFTCALAYARWQNALLISRVMLRSVSLQ